MNAKIGFLKRVFRIDATRNPESQIIENQPIRTIEEFGKCTRVAVSIANKQLFEAGDFRRIGHDIDSNK